MNQQDPTIFEAPTFSHGASVALPFDTVTAAIEHWMMSTPDGVAVEHEGRSITYRELDAQSEIVAHRLRSSGIGAGDNVGVFLRRSIEMVVAIVAVARTGAAYVPQDARIATAVHLEHVMKTADITTVLTLAEFADAIPTPQAQQVLAIDLDSPDAAPAPAPAPAPVPVPVPVLARKTPANSAVHADDTCFVLFTSGTTGKPNGVIVTHRNVCNVLLGGDAGLSIQPGERVTQILNIAFDMAAWEIFGALTHGATLVVRGPDIAAAARTAHVIIATPSILATLRPEDCPSVRAVAVAGEPCPISLATHWARFSEFYNSCGPTEVTIVNTMTRIASNDTEISIGRPLPNTSVYVLNADMALCDVGEIGEMWVGGDCVTAGYIGNPELTAERYRPNPFADDDSLMFRTRDLASWRDDGLLIHHGRTDDQVKVRGFRVELDSVSAVLESHPGCERAVTMRRDSRTIVAFVTPSHVNVAELLTTASAHLPYYSVPAEVIPLQEVPLTPRGKVDKALLAQLDQERHHQSSSQEEVAA